MGMILALLLLVSFGTSANEVTFGFGSVTAHFFNNTQMGPRYANKLNERGLILNPMQSIGYGLNNTKHTLFWGSNSVGLNMFGYNYTQSLSKNETFDFGLLLGFYFQDSAAFTQKSGLIPPGVGDFTPVMGLNLDYIFYKDRNISYKMQNVVTPVLSTHALGITIEFK
jgi:hypothetical protein